LQRLVLRIEKQTAVGCRRSRLATVVGAQRALAPGPVQHERPAADAGSDRLSQAEHHLHRDRRVDRGAAALEHVVPRIDRERMRGRDDEGLPGLRLANGAENKKGGRSRPSEKRFRDAHTIKGTTSSATMLMILISGLTAGPAVSL